MSEGPPRLVVAGTGGDSGKTLVSLGLAGAFLGAGRSVAAFKKGPDYIDAAWLTRAAGRPARNLDTWMMGVEAVRSSLGRHAAEADVSVIEGNRGLFDGLDGSSTAELARAVDAPVILVLPVTKVTRTAAAFVAGVRVIDPDVRLAGVILNRVGGPRHEREAREAIEQATGVPVLGAIPRLDGPNLLPDRHLGLVPPSEHARMDEVVERLAEVLAEHADLETLFEVARTAGPLAAPVSQAPTGHGARARMGGRVGVFKDAAFTFYYPENLEALEAAGAGFVDVSPLSDPGLPDVDLLYVGGGFPETHAPALAANRPMLRSVRRAVDEGLPVFAECGGLIYLSRSVTFEGSRSTLAGVLEVDCEVHRKPQGHGYVEAVVDRANPFFAPRTTLRGHEFHYTRVASSIRDADLCLDIRRGVGSRAGRGGLVRGDVFASWVHLHALGTPGWAPALVDRAAGRTSRQDTENTTFCGSTKL